MRHLQIAGCGTAMVTPFNNDFTVDYNSYRNLVKRQIDAGIHFLVPLGTTAETPCLETEEKIRLLEITKEECGSKFPIIVGAGSNCTKHVLENIKLLEKYGADAFLIVTPYYNKPTQIGLYNHFKEIALSTDKPIIMYNVPGRTGVNLSAETSLKLAEIENIAGIKEASGNYAQICEIIRNCPERFSVLSGNDDETLSLMASGAKGVISVASNIAPEIVVSMVEKIMSGDMAAARALHYKLLPLFKNCFIESNPIPVKAALNILGLSHNILRPPLCAGTQNTVKIMKDTLSAYEKL